MAIYETVVILDSLLPTKEIDDIIERCSTVIKENGGSVRTVDKWGKRRLAYEIQKKQYGFYFTIEFEGEGDIPSVLQSEYNYNDNVLRYLTYKYDKHKLQAMEQAPVVKPEIAATPDSEKEVVTPDESPEAIEDELEEEAEVDVEETPAEEEKLESIDETLEVSEEAAEEESTKEAKDE